jgi:hypothetical protein
MFLALAILLIQPQVTPQIYFSAEKIILIEAVKSAPSGSFSLNEMSSPLAPAASDIAVEPPANTDPAAPPNAPEPAPAATPGAITLVKSGKGATVSVNQLSAEGRRNEHIWMGLGIAAHSAATFDAWSTRHAITTSGAQELNPMLRPFAGNASLYAVIQVGPVVMDYVGKKMMYSRHNWVRHMWWVPQGASFVSSMFCGAHNLAGH